MERYGPVLLFDGECGLCMRCVRWLLTLDRRKRLKFAPLQGETAQTYLRLRGMPGDDFDSAIFVADWARREELAPVFKTDALLASLAVVDGLGRVVYCLKMLPRNWRDAVYDWVARRRFQLFGPVDVAVGWKAADRERLLL